MRHFPYIMRYITDEIKAVSEAAETLQEHANVYQILA